MRRSLPILLALLGFGLVGNTLGQNQDWKIVTPGQEIVLQNDSLDLPVGLFFQVLQIRTKSNVGSGDLISVNFTSDGWITAPSFSLFGKNTIKYGKRVDHNGSMTHELQIKLSNPVQYKIEGCTSNWANFTTNCGPSIDGFDIWTIWKNKTVSDAIKDLVITCNKEQMIELLYWDYGLGQPTESCTNNWTRSMDSFKLMADPNLVIDGFYYRLPPGCLSFPDSWFDRNLRTDTFFPIPYQKTFRLFCDHDSNEYPWLLVGDREISCDPYLGLEGGFEYSTTPECVVPDLRDWRHDVGIEVLVPISLTMGPIEIKTTARPGSNELLIIQFQDILNSKFNVKFSNPMQYWIKSCTDGRVDFQCDAIDDIRIWTINCTISKEHTYIRIGCNGKTMVDDCSQLSYLSVCDIDQFWFDAETTVSYSVKADLTTWRPKLPGDQNYRTDGPMNLGKYPLQFKTNSTLGSGDFLGIDFNADSFEGFRFTLKFGDRAVYRLENSCHYHCYYSRDKCNLIYEDSHNLDLTPCYAVNDKENEIIWTLERNENTVLVFCNGIQMIDYEEEIGKQSSDSDLNVCPNWKLFYARLLVFFSSDNATISYRYIPKSCDSIPQDWTGVKPPPQLPVPDGTEVRLSCLSEEEIVNVNRVVTCNTRYPGGFQYQVKPECIRADGEVTFEPRSPIFVHDLSNSVQFTCIYFGLKVPDEVVWYKDSAAENRIVLEKFKYTTGQFDDDTYKQRSVLKIENISIDDSGGYICKCNRTNSDVNDVSNTMTVNVRTLQMAQDTYYSTDGSINLECKYRGKSQGSLQWFYKSDKITEDGNVRIAQGNLVNNTQTFSLSIADVSVEQNRGKYSCVWSNNDGDKIEVETEVVVRRAKILSDLSFENQPYKYVEGYILELQCQLDGDIEPDSVVWQNGDSDIIFDGLKKRMTKSIIHHPDYGVRYFSNIALDEPENFNDGEYTCKFSFADDENQVITTAKVVKINVKTAGPFIFLDYKEQTDISVNCSLQGDLVSVGASVQEVVLTFNGANIFSHAGTNQINHYITDVSNGNDGIYKCNFTLDDGVEFSATQQLIARKATLQLLLNSNPVKELVSGFKLNLVCIVDGGAESISWFKNDEELTSYKTVHETKVQLNDELTERLIIALVIKNNNDDAIDDIFKCRGMISSAVMPEKYFDSSGIPLRVFPAKARKAPANGHAYEGDQYEFLCQFPDSDVKTQYTVLWKFNEQDVVHKDWNKIETKRNDSSDSAFIETRFKINTVDSRVNGKYSCSITWLKYGVVIESAEAKLAVRSIIETPSAFFMASGANATLTCTAIGDRTAVISILEVNGDKDIILDGVEITETQDDQERVTTVGRLTPNLTASADVYCAVKWDDDTKILKSDPVSLTVMTVNIKSPDAPDGWVVQNSTLLIECVSDALLNQYGEDNSPEKVYAAASIEWMLRIGSLPSKWNKIDGNGEFRNEIKEPKITEDGRRISTLNAGPIKGPNSGYEFKCDVTYLSDDSKNFYGGVVSSEEFNLTTRPDVNGQFQQVWTFLKAGFTVCDASSPDIFSESNMKKILTDKSDICGAYPVVPCLKNNECTLEETGCSWDSATKSLTMFYKVKVKKGVWTVQEKEALVNLPPQSKLRFWDCGTTEPKPSEEEIKYLKRMTFDDDSNTIMHKEASHTGLYVGIALATLLVIGSAIIVYYRKKLKNASVSYDDFDGGSIGIGQVLMNVLSGGNRSSPTAQI